MIVSFIIGFLIGGVFGCAIMSALIAAGEADRQDEKIRRERGRKHDQGQRPDQTV